MLFNSLGFSFGLLPASLVLYFAAGRYLGATAAKLTIIAIALCFYLTDSSRDLAILIVSVVANYGFAALLLKRCSEQKPRGFILSAGIAVNLALLVVFKYSNFGISILDSIAGTYIQFL